MVSVSLENGMNLKDDLYDMTGSLQLHFPDMHDAYQQVHGYDHYRMQPVPA